jgi:hypothetical protein
MVLVVHETVKKLRFAGQVLEKKSENRGKGGGKKSGN